jgi:hypothetical protein
LPIVALATSVSFAQQYSVKMFRDTSATKVTDTSTKVDTTLAHPDTKAGSAAFMFTFSGLGAFGMNGFPIENFTLTAAGETLNATLLGGGGKWYFMDELALRGLFGLMTQSKGNVDSIGKTSSVMYGFSGGVEKHFEAISTVSAYVGAQLSFAYASLDNKKSFSNKTIENKETASTFGIGPLIGFDWYFTSGLAVGGEFLLGYSTTSTSVTTPDATGVSVTTDNPTASKIIISSANVHLAVHF